MRDPASQLTDRLHLLRLAQRFLGPGAFFRLSFQSQQRLPQFAGAGVNLLLQSLSGFGKRLLAPLLLVYVDDH